MASSRADHQESTSVHEESTAAQQASSAAESPTRSALRAFKAGPTNLLGWLLSRFSEMPLWVRVVTYLVLLAVCINNMLRPHFVYGHCYFKNDVSGSYDQFKLGMVGYYIESHKVFAEIDDDGNFAVPVVTKTLGGMRLLFTEDRDTHKTQYPVNIGLRALVTGEQIPILVTRRAGRISFAVASFKGNDLGADWQGFFSRPAYAEDLRPQPPHTQIARNSPTGAAVPLSENDIHQQVVEVLAQVARASGAPLAPREALPADVLQQSQVISLLEKQLQVTISADDWSKFKSAADVAQHINIQQRIDRRIYEGLTGPLVGILKAGRIKREGKDIYLRPEIPHGKEEAARTSTKVPQQEQVLGLVDTTLFGTADHALVFGSRGIYYKTYSARTSGPAQSFIAYSEFPRRDFAASSDSEVSLGNDEYFVVSRSDVEADRLALLLNQIKKLVASRTSPATKP